MSYLRLYVGGSSLPPVVCRRAHVLFTLSPVVRLYLQLFVGGLMFHYLRSVRLYLQLFVGGLMSYLRSVRLYLQLFVGGLMYYLRSSLPPVVCRRGSCIIYVWFVFTSSCL